ncbi:tRNA epoxyqueuosine(34) reductase QueG [Fulvivirga sedimenti]|uniref:Epoxyqueuosine reductase n=1 Tax=Fulvivirga sedimenti TaxID=2879465 RepID=A0A9X1HWT6_9BACT|nr:tRNA epoxyqueuosine(34) reductase QueG [Fulvivirga sedimenti]MCA6078237.1 tRNA epoxyqueuosine(34) reductase QueG [Fulvivirga sedimenti]
MSSTAPDHHHRIIKEISKELGFMHCGVSKAEFLEDEAPRLEKWLSEKHHGTMSWMENHFDKRLDPRLLVSGAKTVISLLYNYTPSEPLPDNSFKISKYAYGEDYHFVIKDKLKDFLGLLREKIGDIDGRIFVDSAPVLERAWARRSGTGWIGKHSLLLNRHHGSYFFLAELIIDLEVTPDTPTGDYCGTCTACIDACPTDAITEPYVVDSNRCISYLTIELRDAISPEFRDTMNDWMFGCDICQDVCPWNRFATPHNEPAFRPSPELLDMTRNDWIELSEETFRRLFRKSAVKRTKFNGLKRTITFLSEK